MAYRDYDRDREFREDGYSSREEAEENREEVGREGTTRRGPDQSDRGFRGPDFSDRDFGNDLDRPDRRPDRDDGDAA